MVNVDTKKLLKGEFFYVDSNKIDEIFNNFCGEKDINNLRKEIYDLIGKEINDNNFDSVFSYIKSIENENNFLNLLIDFLDKINYTERLDVYLKLLKGSQKLDEIIEKNFSLFKDLDDQKIISLLVDAYSIIHNINIFDDDIEEISSIMPKNKNSDKVAESSMDFYKSYMSKPLLTRDEQYKIATAAKNGDKRARDLLIERNIKLVLSIAKRYVGRGLDYDELVHEGIIGLFKAIDRFDPSKGYAFSTFSTWWIRQNIERTTNEKGRNIYIPNHVHKEIYDFKRASERLTKEIGYEPDLYQMAEELGITYDKASLLQRYQEDTVSLNGIAGSNDSDTTTELIEFMIDNKVNVEDEIVKKDNIDFFYKIIDQANLTDKEYMVLCKRNGLKGYDVHTLEQIGKEEHVTRERIRQIESKAMKKLEKVAKLYSENKIKILDKTQKDDKKIEEKKIVVSVEKKKEEGLCEFYGLSKLQEIIAYDIIGIFDYETQVLVYKKYGTNLHENNKLDQREKILLNNFRKKFKEIFDEIKDIDRLSDEYKTKLFEKDMELNNFIEPKSLISYFEYKYNFSQILSGINGLKEREISQIYESFGKNLNNSFKFKNQKSKIIDIILPRLNNKLKMLYPSVEKEYNLYLKLKMDDKTKK